jgi:hypothetical protein
MNETPDAPAHSPGYETTDIHVGGILAFAGGLVILAVVLHGVLAWMFDSFAAREARLKQQVSPLAAEERGQLPPEPRLEGLEATPPSPTLTLPQGRGRVRVGEGDRGIGAYAWVDRKAGVVRIPIENAMNILANRLPSRPNPEGQIQRAEPGGSNSGRTPPKGSP